MSVETHRVVIGACGWKHSSWVNNFYDEDLPEDWQLGFYANEFPIVCVPSSDWIQLNDISEWLDDISDSFRFILEIPENTLMDADAYSAALTKIKSLGEACLGIVLPLNQNLCSDIEFLKKRLILAQEVASVCVDKKNVILTDEVNKVLIKLHINEVWKDEILNDGVSDASDRNHGSLAISHVSSDNLAMPELRKIIEYSLSASNEGCISVLCIDGTPPSLEVLRNSDTLLNLL